jgi:hypothetical protein
MTRHLTLITFLACLGTVMQAQHRLVLGITGGAATSNFKKDYTQHRTHNSLNTGLELGYRIWGGLCLNGGVEYQQRSYTGPTTSFTGVPMVTTLYKQSLSYQLGLMYRFKHFYAKVAPTFSDNLDGREARMGLFMCCDCVVFSLPPLEYFGEEYFSAWGISGALGTVQPIGPRTSALLELGFQSEPRQLDSEVVQPLRVFGFRVGLQYGFGPQ